MRFVHSLAVAVAFADLLIRSAGVFEKVRDGCLACDVAGNKAVDLDQEKVIGYETFSSPRADGSAHVMFLHRWVFRCFFGHHLKASTEDSRTAIIIMVRPRSTRMLFSSRTSPILL